MFSAVDRRAQKAFPQVDPQELEGSIEGKMIGERRRCARPHVPMDAAFRPRKGVKCPTVMVNLTLGGGCMEAGFVLSEGTDGWLQLPTLSDWLAKVVWRRGPYHGLAFASPLHGAVLDMLVGRAVGERRALPDRRRPRDNKPVVELSASRREQILAGVAVCRRSAPPVDIRRRTWMQSRES